MKKTIVAGALFAGLSFLFITTDAHAESMGRYDSRMAVTMQNSVSTATTSEFAPFEATLQDPACVNGVCLPVGTLFKGHVAKVKAGKEMSLNTPSVGIHIDQVRFPSGFALALHYDPNQSNKIYTLEQLEKKQADGEYQVVKIAGAGLSFVSMPASIATRVAAGAVVGSQNESGSAPDAVAKGIYKSTPIPGVLDFVNGKDDITYVKGQTVYFRLPAEVAQSVFSQYQANATRR